MTGRMLCIGDDVEILTGSMKNKSGKIIKTKKNYFVIRIDQFDAIVCINIGSVVPINRIK